MTGAQPTAADCCTLPGMTGLFLRVVGPLQDAGLRWVLSLPSGPSTCQNAPELCHTNAGCCRGRGCGDGDGSDGECCCCRLPWTRAADVCIIMSPDHAAAHSILKASERPTRQSSRVINMLAPVMAGQRPRRDEPLDCTEKIRCWAQAEGTCA